MRTSPGNNWVSNPEDPPAFQFTAEPGPLSDIPENVDPTFFLGLILAEKLLQFMVERMANCAQKVISENTMNRRSRFKIGKQQISLKWKYFRQVALYGSH